MKKNRTSLILIAVFACFLVGILSVIIRRNTLPLTSSKSFRQLLAQDPTSLDLSSNSYNVLVLGVDEVVSPDPRLLAVWYISISESDEPITLLGCPTDYVPPGSSFSLADSFDWTAITGFEGFDVTPFELGSDVSISATIVLDSEGFAKVIDFIGGVNLNGEHMDGASVLGVMSMLYDEPEASLTLQVETLRALLSGVQLVGSTPELTPLTSLIPDHASVSQPPGELASLAIPFLPIESDNVIIRTLYDVMENIDR